MKILIKWKNNYKKILIAVASELSQLLAEATKLLTVDWVLVRLVEKVERSPDVARPKVEDDFEIQEELESSQANKSLSELPDEIRLAVETAAFQLAAL